ncbi:MAG: S9 family peptidase [Cyclobacteriaceae bacterium]|nr:S9 family peptidase [Cyclobacteriaceae bacterium]
MKNTWTLFFLLTSLVLSAQNKLTIDQVMDGTFRQKSVSHVNWMNDGRFYSALNQNRIIKYDVASGAEVAILVDGNQLNIPINDYEFSQDEEQVLLLTDRQSVFRRSFTARYFLYNIATGSIRSFIDDRISYATFSPDGKKVAFTNANNLYYKNLTTDEVIQITTDGKLNAIINGSSDWVYEEELFITKAFEWSPDSRKIAYFRFDESQVPEYNMQQWNEGALYPSDYRYKYPKAGEKNAEIDIYLYHLSDNQKVKADIGTEKDIYIPRIYWTKNPEILSVQRLNRLQNKLDILHVKAQDGSSTTVLTDQSGTYIDFTFCDDLRYLDNGNQFLFSSEKDGYKHFYLYTMEGKLVRQVTSGAFEASDFVGLNQTKKDPVLYYLSTEVSPLERHLYSINLSGKGKKKLTAIAGISSIDMSPDCTYYMNYQSSAQKPLSVLLYKTASNSLVKELEDNQQLQNTSREFGLSPKEFFTLNASDGTLLNGYFLKPADFDPNKKYPVLVYQYSGPGSQNVSNSWGGGHFIWHQLLVQKGYVIAVIDTRGTGYRGEAFKKITYKQLGKLEAEDHITAGHYLAGLSWVDSSRIGIWGWSYGGYMSSLVLLKGADVFKSAIAVAPVTTWRYYDSIYTERYLQRPQDNPEGYDQNSPIQFTDALKGNFLLIHGTGDDNVHFQNAVALQDKLIDSGKQFESFYYPDRAHGLGNRRGHLYEMMTRFILENL